MIIVKTKDGCHFLNDKQLTEVRHAKENQTVWFYGENTSDTITDVESVTYISDTQAVEWKDEGSENATLRAELADEKKGRWRWFRTSNLLREYMIKIEANAISNAAEPDPALIKITTIIEACWRDWHKLQQEYDKPDANPDEED